MSKSRGTFITARSPPGKKLNPGGCALLLRRQVQRHHGRRGSEPRRHDRQRSIPDLVGKFVNCRQSLRGFIIAKRFDGKLGSPRPGASPSTGTWTKSVPPSKPRLQPRPAQDHGVRRSDNAYVNDNKPWELAKREGQDARLHVVCSSAINIFKALTGLLKPVLPAPAAQVESFLTIEP